jgi:broad specificity phosphatase PhoE
MSLFCSSALLPAAAGGRPVLVFSHGMAIKCLLRRILGSDARMSRRIRLDNTAVTELVHDGTHWEVARVNDTAHLLQL